MPKKIVMTMWIFRSEQGKDENKFLNYLDTIKIVSYNGSVPDFLYDLQSNPNFLSEIKNEQLRSDI